jgi:uncharacterized integral membrane protein
MNERGLMSSLEKEKGKAKMISNLQKWVAYVTYFLILGLVIFVTYIIQNNWGMRVGILPPPIPYQSLVILGLALLSSIIVLQAILVYQLFKLRKEALKNKKSKRKTKKLKDIIVNASKTRKKSSNGRKFD